MHLKSLEINGFKSFAKKGHLIFNTPITAIVGPNGSGKSNVAEAFRFVLGEQSIKSMRGKKGEDLIFNGGKDTPRSNRASVKLVFDNAIGGGHFDLHGKRSERLFNVEFDEVSIERVVHRDGVNEYFLNGSQVRLKDVVELLAHANIGSSGHHIISQGEADRLLSAQTKERKEMIEDALGLKVYQYKKEESEKRLQKTAIHMKEVESLRREIAPHIKFLKKQVEKIERAVSIRNELIEKYKKYFGNEARYLNSIKKEIEQEKKEPEAELGRLEKELAEHRQVLDLAKQAERENSKTGVLLELEAEIRKTRQEKDACVREIGKLEGEISYLKRAIQKKAEALAESHSKQIYLKEVEDLAKKIDEKISTAVSGNDIETAIQALHEIRSAFTDFLNYHHANEDQANTESEEQEISRITSEMQILEEKLKALGEKEAVEAEKYSSIKIEIDKDKDQNVESEKAVLKIMSRQNDLHNHLEIIKARAEKVRLEQADFDRELYEAGILLGRSAIAYEEENQTDESGTILNTEMNNDRTVQINERREIEKLKIRLEEVGGAGGEDVMREYKEAEERDAFLAKELEDLKTSSDALLAMIAELDEKLSSLFKEGIEKINVEFNKFFTLMFGGGSAGLSIIREVKRKRKKILSDMDALDDLDSITSSSALGMDSDDEGEEEIEEGIEINVALPHKRTKGLMMLSGGERALTSIALLFAMSQVNPPPFVILDETDAALDEANSRKYGDMIEALSKHSQLILITHNRETMSRAGVIYGVTMDAGGYSKLLSIAFETAQGIAK